MKKMNFLILLSFLYIFSINCLAKVQNKIINSHTFTLEILHVNDLHSHFEPVLTSIHLDNKKFYLYAGGYAKIANFIKNKKAKNSHILSLLAGDAVQGTLYYTIFKGKADIAVLNKMDIDIMTLGNHEFDDGADILAKNFVSKAKFDIVCCDVKFYNKELKKIVKPYVIKKIDNNKIAIVGNTVNSSVISNPGPTVKFLNYITSAKRVVDKLKSEGINKILFLTHLGYKKDQILAKKVPSIDIIVGGHSHTLLGDFANLGLFSSGKYPTIIKHKNSQTLIVTSWKWGQIVGDIKVTFDNKGNIKSYTAQPIMLIDDKFLVKNKKEQKVEVSKSMKKILEKKIFSMPNIKIESQDKSVEAIINKYKPFVKKLMSAKIAQATIKMPHIEIPKEKILYKSSMVAPYIALAMYQKANENGKCDLAIQNAGGIRASISKGDITVGEIYTILPFGDDLVTLRMKGKYLLNMLENAIDISLIKKTHVGAFPYIAGAKMMIKESNPKNHRIIMFKIKKGNKWIKINKNKIYNVAVNSYIARGGSYYNLLKQKKIAMDKYDTGFICSSIFLKYLKKIKILRPFEENKVLIIEK